MVMKEQSMSDFLMQFVHFLCMNQTILEPRKNCSLNLECPPTRGLCFEWSFFSKWWHVGAVLEIWKFWLTTLPIASWSTMSHCHALLLSWPELSAVPVSLSQVELFETESFFFNVSSVKLSVIVT